MSGYTGNIEEITLENTNFRRVLFTGPNSQLVVMCLKPGEDIGAEVHLHVDQFFRFEKGEGKVVIDSVETLVTDKWAVVVPAGSNHNVINTSSDEDLKLYTIYTPPQHPDGTIHATKTEADAAELTSHS